MAKPAFMKQGSEELDKNAKLIVIKLISTSKEEVIHTECHIINTDIDTFMEEYVHGFGEPGLNKYLTINGFDRVEIYEVLDYKGIYAADVDLTESGKEDLLSSLLNSVAEESKLN